MGGRGAASRRRDSPRARRCLGCYLSRWSVMAFAYGKEKRIIMVFAYGKERRTIMVSAYGNRREALTWSACGRRRRALTLSANEKGENLPYDCVGGLSRSLRTRRGGIYHMIALGSGKETIMLSACFLVLDKVLSVHCRACWAPLPVSTRKAAKGRSYF